MARREPLTLTRFRSLIEIGDWEQAWREHEQALEGERGRLADLWRGAGEYVGYGFIVLCLAGVFGGGITALVVKDRRDNAAQERACASGQAPACTVAVEEQAGHDNSSRVEYLLSLYQQRTGRELPKTRY